MTTGTIISPRRRQATPSGSCQRSTHRWFADLLLAFAFAAVLLRSAGAVPLDALRSIWVAEDDTWSQANPAHLARQRELHSEFEVGHHLLVRSSDRESATWNISGRQLIPLAKSALQLHLQRTGTGWRYLFDDARLSSRPLGQEHLDLAYGRAFGRYLDLGYIAGRGQGKVQ